MYFSDPYVERSLMVAHVEDDSINDRYVHLNGDMTVFGFGRNNTLVPQMTAVPQTFVVALIDGISFAPTARTMRARLDPMTATIGPIATEVEGAVPPSAIGTVSAATGPAPLTVTVDATASTDDGTLTGIVWEFGNGETATTAVAQVEYTTPGRYLITLTVYR